MELRSPSIYLGDITKWDDPRIKRLNPDWLCRARLSRRCTARTAPAPISCFPTICRREPRVPVDYRRQYLGAMADGIGAKGNEGVANMTAQTDGAIGYVEYAYAKQNKMAFTLLTNKSGSGVTPNAESFQAAASNADWAPLIRTTDIDRPARRQKLADHRRELYSLLQGAPRSRAVKEALKFFAWAYKDGAQWPQSSTTCRCRTLIAQVKKTWSTEISSGGHPLWTGK